MSDQYIEEYADALMDHLESSDRFHKIIKKIMRAKTTRFKPPKKEEVFNYASEKGRLDLYEAFWTHFTESEPKWVDAQGKPVRNWKQKFLTWCGKNQKPKNATNNETYI